MQISRSVLLLDGPEVDLAQFFMAVVGEQQHFLAHQVGAVDGLALLLDRLGQVVVVEGRDLADPLRTAVDDPRVFCVDVEEEVVEASPELEAEAHLQHHPAFVDLPSLEDQDAVAEEEVDELLLGRVPEHVVGRGEAVVAVVVLPAEVEVVLEEGGLVPLADVAAVEQKGDDWLAAGDERVEIVVQFVGVVEQQAFSGQLLVALDDFNWTRPCWRTAPSWRACRRRGTGGQRAPSRRARICSGASGQCVA